LKETELTRLKYIAIDEAYFGNFVTDFHSTIAGLKRAVDAMTNLKEVIIVRDITNMRPDFSPAPRVQIRFYADDKLGEAEEGWPADVEELPDVQEYTDRKPSSTVKMTALYGWRAI